MARVHEMAAPENLLSDPVLARPGYWIGLGPETQGSTEAQTRNKSFRTSGPISIIVAAIVLSVRLVRRLLHFLPRES